VRVQQRLGGRHLAARHRLDDRRQRLISSGDGPRVQLPAVGVREQVRLVQEAVALDVLDERVLVAVPLLRSSISSSVPALRRRRMIWLIGATPFGQASMQLKQWVQS
jgi:hypothetical protein